MRHSSRWTSGDTTWSCVVSTTALGRAIPPSHSLESNAIASVAAWRIARVSCFATWSMTHRPWPPSADRGASTAIIAARGAGEQADCRAASRGCEVVGGRAQDQPAHHFGMAAREQLSHQSAERVTDHDHATELEKLDDGRQVVRALGAVELACGNAVAVPSQVGGDDAEMGGELRHGQRPVEVRAREQAVHQKYGGRSCWPNCLAQEDRAAAMQVEPPTGRHLRREMQFREVEAFEARALDVLPATSGWSTVPEHLAPPSGPVGLGEGERRNRPLPLRSESGTQRVGARTRDWSSAMRGQVLAPRNQRFHRDFARTPNAGISRWSLAPRAPSGGRRDAGRHRSGG